MAGVIRHNGTVEEGGIFSYPPVMVKVASTGGFLADTVAGDGAITENGYSKAAKTLALTSSIIWIGAQDDDSFTCMVEGNVFPVGADDITALTVAMELINDAGTAVVTVSTVLNGDGTFTYA
jgi:hypothetical protein